MTWSSELRRHAFDRVPRRWRPVATYHYFRARALLDRELQVLCAELDPGSCAVDAGANEGVYTHAFARTGARVEAFEPHPWCYDVLASYARSRPRVRVHPEALGSAELTTTLHVPFREDRPVSSHATLRAPEGPALRIDVNVRTLDSFAFRDVRVIKIDVEGGEADVLLGARQTIERWRPVLLVEIERRHLQRPMKEVFALILELGYVGSFLHPEHGALPIDAFDAEKHQSASNADRPHALYINNFIFRASRTGRTG